MGNEKIGIIIQARMGSHRLPGKILMDFVGKPLLGHIVDRLTGLRHRITAVMATSILPQDDVVEEFCQNYKIMCFRGSEGNVLERYMQCASHYGFSQIVRMTGDNPFPDMEELDRMIACHLNHGNDFSENFSELPIGVGAEIITYRALEDSYKFASLPKHFEHADEYILDHLERYKHETVHVPTAKNLPGVRLTVDTPEDYRKACYILREANGQFVTTELAIRLEEKYHMTV